MSDSPEVRVIAAEMRMSAFLTRYWHLLLGVIIAVCYFSYWFYWVAFNDRNYMPLQPIPYSHKLHVGEHGLDCQYCHYNAARGKHAGVPPISVCMGCHDPAKGGVGDGIAEVEKLRELVLDNGEIRPEYADTDDLDYMTDGSMKVGGQVHWNRIHRLPDHVYFRHEWHVDAGISCQTCHGPIEEMEVVSQHARLTMGWCIDCHRKTNYVGGPEYDGTDETFTVGTANYEVIRARIAPDQAVDFVPRHTKGAHHDDHHGDHDDKHHGNHDDKSHDEHHHGGKNAELVRELRGLTGSLYGHTDDSVHNLSFFSKAQAKVLNDRLQDNDEKRLAGLDVPPRWRVADLPSIHAEFYNMFENESGERVTFGEITKDMTEAEKADFLRKHIRRFESYQNAPTQCSTCHQ